MGVGPPRLPGLVLEVLPLFSSLVLDSFFKKLWVSISSHVVAFIDVKGL